MIAALARGGTVFGRPGWIDAAERAASFLFGALRLDSGRLLHRFRDGDAAIRGFLDDYAFLAWGLAELGEATGKKEYFDSAASLLDVLQ